MTRIAEQLGSAAPPARVARTVVPGAAMVAMSFGLARYGYGLLLPEMRSELGLSPNAAGLISSGTYASYLVANIAVISVTSRWGARTAIALAAALGAGGMAVVAAAHSAAVLAVGVVVAGAASGLAYPPYADLVATQVPLRRRDLAWSAISSGTGWGVAVAGPIAIVAGERWRVAWLLFVALSIGIGVLAVRLAPPQRAVARQARPQLSWTWFLCPRSRPLLLSAVLVGTGSAVWWVFSVDSLRDAGIGADSARIAYAVCGAAGILASGSGAVFSRLGLRAGYLVACTLLGASLAVLGLATANLGAALIAAVLFGAFFNAVVAAQGIWSSRVFADHPAAGLAAVNTALTLGTLIGPILAGVAVAGLGFESTLVAAGVTVLAALLFSPPTNRREQALAAHQCRATPVRG
jgi:predicted MFS family arabinose efflux permease